jgi:hypothetical protein
VRVESGSVEAWDRGVGFVSELQAGDRNFKGQRS